MFLKGGEGVKKKEQNEFKERNAFHAQADCSS